MSKRIIKALLRISSDDLYDPPESTLNTLLDLGFVELKRWCEKVHGFGIVSFSSYIISEKGKEVLDKRLKDE